MYLKAIFYPLLYSLYYLLKPAYVHTIDKLKKKLSNLYTE